MSTARELVTRRVARRARQFPELELTALETAGLETRDAALAAAIDHAVATRWLTLVAVLQSRLRQPWDRLEPRLQGVLLVGAAQLLLLDRVPEHAAINEAVDLAKRLVRPGAGGLTNAVLRGVADLRRGFVTPQGPPGRDELPRDDGRAWRLAAPIFDEEPGRRVGQQTSHPETLLAHWERAFGRRTARDLAHHDLFTPPIIVAGPAAFAGPVAETAPHAVPGFRVFTGPRGRIAALLAEHPSVRVQDPATAEPVAGTAHLDARLIVDFCAGRGTKTRQLLEVHPHARIIATDVDAGRLATLRQSFGDDERVTVLASDELMPWRGRIDLVVLDVPCSNTGVLARRPEAKYRFSDGALKSLVDLQRQIVADAIPLLTDRGHLLYATCSIEALENVEQARWIRRWHRMRIDSEHERRPAGQPGDPPTCYTDGGYHAVLGRDR